MQQWMGCHMRWESRILRVVRRLEIPQAGRGVHVLRWMAGWREGHVQLGMCRNIRLEIRGSEMLKMSRKYVLQARRWVCRCCKREHRLRWVGEGWHMMARMAWLLALALARGLLYAGGAAHGWWWCAWTERHGCGVRHHQACGSRGMAMVRRWPLGEGGGRLVGPKGC